MLKSIRLENYLFRVKIFELKIFCYTKKFWFLLENVYEKYCVSFGSIDDYVDFSKFYSK